MDDYPPFSLDHNIPLLVTLGVQSNSAYDFTPDPSLKAQAVLLRSEEPSLESDQAQALLKYIQDHDASELPWNGQDTARRYKFRVRTAARVGRITPL